jgi:hypothetical protein
MPPIPPEFQAANLRAGRLRDSGDATEGLRNTKYFLLLFLSIFGSIFLNSLNLFSRRAGSVSLTALLAFAFDFAIIGLFPANLVFPIIVTVSSTFAGRPLRPGVVFACTVLSFVVALSIDPARTYTPWMLASIEQCGMIQAVAATIASLAHKPILARIKFFLAGLLVACSALVSKSIVFAVKHGEPILSLPLAVTGLVTLVLLRRSVRLTLRGQLTPEYGSWSVISVSLVFFDPNADKGIVLVLALVVGVFLRFSVTTVPVVNHNKQPEIEQLANPAPIQEMTLTQRRKIIPSTPSETMEVEMPAVSEVSTAVSSGILVVQPSTTSTMMTAEIESDEEEILRRIANST